MVSTRDRRGVVAAISEVTGLPFRNHARIPFTGVVDVTFRDAPLFLQAMDLSVSGLSLRGFPQAGRGEMADLVLDVADHPVQVQGMVVRTFDVENERCVGLSFVNLSQEAQRRIDELVQAEQRLATHSWNQLAEHASTGGARTMDLVLEMGGGLAANGKYFELLRHAVVTGVGAALPTWLDEVRRALVSEERRMLRGESATPWADATVRARIDLGRQLFSEDPEPSYQVALELCGVLADESAGTNPNLLVQATRVRADLLRSINALVLSKAAFAAGPHARAPSPQRVAESPR